MKTEKSIRIGWELNRSDGRHGKIKNMGNRSAGSQSDRMDATDFFFLENEHEKKRTFKTKKKHNQNPRQWRQKLDVRFVSAIFNGIMKLYNLRILGPLSCMNFAAVLHCY